MKPTSLFTAGRIAATVATAAVATATSVVAALAVAGCSSPGPSGPVSSVELSMKVTVPAGAELHDCQFVKMPVGERFIVSANHHFTPGSHHLLLFRTDLAAIPAGGDQIQDCYEGGGGTIMSHVRGVVYGSQVADGTQPMPPGVGFHLASEEVLLLQVHYLNATQSPLDAQVHIGLTTTTDASKIENRAGVLFYYNPFIDVPPSSMARAGARCTLAHDLHLQTIFPHFHSRGQSYEAFLDLPGQPPSMTPFYTSADWEHPAAWTGGPMALQAGTKIRFYCDYNNTAGASEYFQGQSAATNEMCMFTGMYYPAMTQADEYCLKDFDEFGVGQATCSATSSCLQACPPGSAPTSLGSGMSGTADVSPCWQKCVTASCPAASTPLFAQLQCIGANCAAECSGGSSACTSCALQHCSNEVGACASAACN